MFSKRLNIVNEPDSYSGFVKLKRAYYTHAKKSIAIRKGWKRHKNEDKQ